MFNTLILIAVFSLSILGGCEGRIANEATINKELLTYCGTTMSAAVKGLAVRSEKNNNSVDALPLKNSVAPLHILNLEMMKTAYDLELDKRFMEFDESEADGQVFRQYGFSGAVQ